MSAIPEAIDKIVTFMGAVGPDVLDGPPVGVWPDQDCIIVGWQREGAGVGIETSPAGFVSTNQENFTVACMISVVGGDLTLEPLRGRAFGFYNTISANIRQDKTLGGAVAHARLSTADVKQYLQKESGGAVEIAFAISCTAFI
jgi:hypothetical protein